MKAAVSLIALVASSAVVASEFNSNAGVSPVRARLHVSRAHARREVGGKLYKRCKPKNQTSSSAAPAPTETPGTTTTYSSPPAATTTPASTGGGGKSGVINVKTSGCGAIGAVANTIKDAGPNGAEAWLTCGIEGGGWNPPMVRVEDLIYKDLDEVMKSNNNIFSACKPYMSIIDSAAEKYGLLPIMIASTMMQESSCNKDTVGGGGEQGLMQITKDKCGGAPGGDCKNPGFNIDAGAKYMKSQLDSLGGNVLEAVGTYNGWVKGLTYGKATAAAKTSCCTCQNNLDYLHEYFNGWMQGIDAYQNNLGTYKNLEQCR